MIVDGTGPFLATEEATSFSVPLLIAAAVAAIVWWSALGVVATARRPPRIRPDAGGGLDLPPEPPAVAAVLAGDFEVAGETAPATVLDLAARDLLELDEVQPGRTICRVTARRGGDGDLAPYERRVLEALAQKAVDGVVPADALTTGPADQSRHWHRALAREVVDDAQARGLTVRRWPARLTTALAVGLAVVVALLALSSQIGADRRASDGSTLIGAIAAAVALGGLAIGAVVVGRIGRSLSQLPTPAGEQAARRCVGLATRLRENESLAALPPAGVRLWDRLFAYAAAFGVAPIAVEMLPMGAEDDRHAWSRHGGRWRRVVVRYPRALPPAWGKHPLYAVALAIFWAVVAGFIGYGLLELLETKRPTEISASAWEWVETGTAALLVPVVLALVWCAWVLWRAVPDLWQTRSVSGDLVRARRNRQVLTSSKDPSYWYYLALDDGSTDRIRAWRVGSELYAEHAQGETVSAEVTPRLGYVRTMTRA